MFCLLFKLPFSSPFHPSQLFSLLFCLFFKQLFSYPFHSLLLFPLIFFLFFKQPFFYPSHPLLLFSLLFCLLFKLPFSYPSHPLLLFLLLFCLLLSCLSPPPHNHRYCSFCYSVSSYPVPFSLFCRTFSSFIFLVISCLRKHIFVKC